MAINTETRKKRQYTKMFDNIILFGLLILTAVYFMMADKPLQYWLEETVRTVGNVLKYLFLRAKDFLGSNKS